jgi:4-hydroxy-tetrahydrodipicolinate synthase
MNQLDQYSLWTAMVTPFSENGEIDFASLKNLIIKQQDAGNAILILGSTGEALALNINEKKQIIEFISNLQLSIPVMVGVGGFRLQEQLDWIEFCNQQKNIHSFLLVTPLYAKPGVKGQIKWFQALLDKAQHPCMLYNIPSRTGVTLYPAVLTVLQDHPNLWALKEASGTLDDFHNYRLAAPKVSLYSGNDDLMPYYALMSDKGLVSVVANVWPQATKLYVQKSLACQSSTLFPLWKDACRALFQVSNPIPVKVLLYKKQWIKSPTLRLPLTHEDIKDIKQLINADQEIEHWFEQNRSYIC